MQLDAFLSAPLHEISSTAAAFEAAGVDGLWVQEAGHEPLLQLLPAAMASDRMALGTGVTIAFGRTPMTTAYGAYDLAAYSGGRFILGLGSQIRPHIERRFSMPWSRPAARMREYVLALRAIWHSWETGEALDFQGDFYTHTLMNEWFTPEVHGFGSPPVYLAGVGPLMTRAAGEVCDGFIMHPFTTLDYVRAATVPALRAGRALAGRPSLDGFTLAACTFVCIGRDERTSGVAIQRIRELIGFYGSTPQYRPVLEQHGWGDLQGTLQELARQERWSDMAEAIDDEIVDTFAVVGDPESVGKQLVERWSGVADRLLVYPAQPLTPDDAAGIAAAVHAAPSRPAQSEPNTNHRRKQDP